MEQSIDASNRYRLANFLLSYTEFLIQCSQLQTAAAIAQSALDNAAQSECPLYCLYALEKQIRIAMFQNDHRGLDDLRQRALQIARKNGLEENPVGKRITENTV